MRQRAFSLTEILIAVIVVAIVGRALILLIQAYQKEGKTATDGRYDGRLYETLFFKDEYLFFEKEIVKNKKNNNRAQCSPPRRACQHRRNRSCADS